MSDGPDSDWQHHDRGSTPLHMRQKRKSSNGSPAITKRPRTSGNSINNTSPQFPRSLSSHTHLPQGAKLLQAQLHEHRINRPINPSDGHLRLSTTNDNETRALLTSRVPRSSDGSPAEHIDSSKIAHGMTNHVHETSLLDEDPQGRFEEALMRQFRQLDNCSLEAQVDALKRFVRYEKKQVWQAKETQHRLESQRDTALAQYQDALSRREAAEAGQAEARSALYNVEASRVEAVKAKAEAESTAGITILESQRMAKRLQELSNDKIALIAERDSGKWRNGQNAELHEKREKINELKANLDEMIKENQILEEKLVAATSAPMSTDMTDLLEELHQLRSLTKEQQTRIKRKDMAFERIQAKLSDGAMPGSRAENPAEYANVIHRLEGAFAKIELLQIQVTDANALLRSTHGPDVARELRTLSDDHRTRLFNKDKEIRKLKISLEKASMNVHSGSGSDGKMPRAAEELGDLVESQKVQLDLLNRKLKAATTALSGKFQNVEDIFCGRSQLLQKHKVELERKDHEIEILKLEQKNALMLASSKAKHDEDVENDSKLVEKHREELSAAQELLDAEKLARRELKKKANANKDEIAHLLVRLDQEKKARKNAEKKLAQEVEARLELKFRLKRLEEGKVEDDFDSGTSSDSSSASESDSSSQSSDGDEEDAVHRGTATMSRVAEKKTREAKKSQDKSKVKKEQGKATHTSSQHDDGRKVKKGAKNANRKKHKQG